MWLCMEIGSLKRSVHQIEVIRVGSNSIGLLSLWEEEIRAQTHRETTMWGHRKKTGVCKPRREGTRHVAPWPQTANLRTVRWYMSCLSPQPRVFAAAQAALLMGRCQLAKFLGWITEPTVHSPACASYPSLPTRLQVADSRATARPGCPP